MHDITFQYYRRTEDAVHVLVPEPGQYQPGHIVALPAVIGQTTYARVTAVRHSRKHALGLVSLSLITPHQPDPNQPHGQLLGPNELLGVIHPLLGRVAYPLTLNTAGGALTTDASRFGPLTWLDARDTQAMLTLLPTLIHGLAQYHRVIVIDPTGLCPGLDGCQTLRIGPDAPLDLQQLGWGTFTRCFSQGLPTPLQGQSLDYLLTGVPDTGFVPFSSLIQPVVTDHALDEGSQRVIQNGLTQLAQLRLFADYPDNTFQPNQLLIPTVVQLGHLPQPWRSAALHGVWQQIQQSPAAVCIWIEPHRFMTDAGLISPQHTVIVASSTPEPGAVNQWHRQHGQWMLEGPLTANFPIKLGHSHPAVQHRLVQTPSQTTGQTTVTDYDDPPQHEPVSTDPNSGLYSMPRQTSPSLTEHDNSEPTYPEAQYPEPEYSEVQPPVNVPLQADVPEPVFATDTGIIQMDDDSPFQFALDKLDALTPTLAEDDLPRFELDGDDPQDTVIYDNFYQNNAAVNTLTTVPPVEDTDWSDLPIPPPYVTPVIAPPPAVTITEPSRQDTEATPPPPSADDSLDHVPAEPPPTFVTADVVTPDRPASQPTATWATGGHFVEGDVVRHPKYGQGTVKKVIWLDADHEVINVLFERAGKRLLDPSLAPLEKI